MTSEIFLRYRTKEEVQEGGMGLEDLKAALIALLECASLPFLSSDSGPGWVIFYRIC